MSLTITKSRQPNTAGTNRILQSKLAEVLSVSDFGALGNYNEDTSTGADDTAAIQAAIDAVSAHSPGRGVLFIPSGAYKITATLSAPYGVSIYGTGGTSSVLHCVSCNAINFTTFGYSIGQMFFEDFGVTAASGSNFAGFATVANASTMDALRLNRVR